MKKTQLAVLSLALLLALAGCGASASNGATPREPAPETEMVESGMDAMAEDSVPLPEPVDPSHSAKRIYRGTLELETRSFQEALEGLDALVADCGGYYQTSEHHDYGGGRSADFTVRVPVEQYRSFFARAGELCHVTWRSEETEDITRQYYDTDGRLKTQETKLARLQELLAKAETMEDIITLESAISDTEYQIEQLSGELRHYDDQVAWSTVTVHLREVYQLSTERNTPKSFGERLSQALGNGLRNFGNVLENLVIWLAYNWIWVILAAAVVAVVLRVRKHRDPNRERKHWFRKKE